MPEEMVPEEEQQLRVQLQAAEDALSVLEAGLCDIESEWEALGSRRVQYESLEHACQSIEKLREEGISRTFWGDRASDEEVAAHLDEVRARIADLGSELTEVEQRRDATREKVEQQCEAVEIIDDELRQWIEQEERRKQEWIVERDETEIPWRLQIMPWTRRQEDDQRFRKSLLGSALACLLLGLLIPYIDIPIPEREDALEVPERLARLIRKERPMPPARPTPQKQIEQAPPEVEPQVEPEVEPEVTPETQFAEKATPESVPESVRDQVASTGLLAFRESFSSLANNRPSARLGSEARINNSGNEAIGLPERSMVATQGPGTSGGLNLAELSRDVGGDGGAGGQIEGVQLSRVASSIGASGSSDRPLSAGAVAGRTDEEIQIVFDRYKAALYRLYNRELRKDPTLRGQMILQLTIEPDGSVSFCELQSSDMKAPMLADQVVNRILRFDFGAKEVPPVTIFYPIDFLPTA
jgi:hypothetical protein